MLSITLLIIALGAGADSGVEGGTASVVPNAPVSVVDPIVAPDAKGVPQVAVETPGAEEPSPDDGAHDADAVSTAVVPAREHLPLGVPDGAATSAGREGDAGDATASTAGLGVWQTIMCTGGVILLILASRWFIVRTVRSPIGSSSLRSQLGVGGRAPSGLLFVLGRYPVSRGASLVLIQLDRRVLLLSQSGAGFQTLAELRDPEEVASIIGKARDEEGESLSAKFSTLMRTFDKRHVETERAESLRAVVRPVRVGTDGDELQLGSVREGDESADAVRERLTALRALVS